MKKFEIKIHRSTILKSLITIFYLITLGITQSVPVISPQEVKTKIDSNEKSIILDVRSKEEFTGELGHIPGAILRPLPEIDHWVEEFEDQKNQEIIVVCRSGNRSSRATSFFLERGFTDVKNMSGGMLEWNKAKFPVEKDSSADSDVK